METDDRRGNGIYIKLENTVKKLKKKNIFWGTSMTVTKMNLATITDETFIKKLNDLGCQMYFFAEYTPVAKGTEEWVISAEQRKELTKKVAGFREKFSALFVSVPGDEDEFGGCLAAGRGFVHVNPEGDVEPCPATPFSDSNLKKYTLKQALQSPLLRAIRESGADLHETRSGCALFQKQEWIRSLMAG